MRSWIELGRKNIIEVTTPRFGVLLEVYCSVLNILDAGDASWVHKNLDRFFIKVTGNHRKRIAIHSARIIHIGLRTLARNTPRNRTTAKINKPR